MLKDTTIEPQQWRVFFDTLSTGLSVREACKRSRILRVTAYRARKELDWIKERWQEALDEGVEYLEDTAHERAVDGVTSTKHIYTLKGELIATQTETRYSDGLLKLLLGARDPRYRQSSSDQVQQRLVQELTRMLDLFQKRLAPDVYAQVIDVLATSDSFSEIGSEAPRYIGSSESDTT